MDTNVLKTFVAVCEYSGFSAAADKLGYTQSTVSSQIKHFFVRFEYISCVLQNDQPVLCKVYSVIKPVKKNSVKLIFQLLYL